MRWSKVSPSPFPIVERSMRRMSKQVTGREVWKGWPEKRPGCIRSVRDGDVVPMTACVCPVKACPDTACPAMTCPACCADVSPALAARLKARRGSRVFFATIYANTITTAMVMTLGDMFMVSISLLVCCCILSVNVLCLRKSRCRGPPSKVFPGGHRKVVIKMEAVNIFKHTFAEVPWFLPLIAVCFIFKKR